MWDTFSFYHNFSKSLEELWLLLGPGKSGTVKKKDIKKGTALKRTQETRTIDCLLELKGLRRS